MLKSAVLSADGPVMFDLRLEPLLLREAEIHGLCVSLNTPVLNIDEQPVGPARAALVLFDGGSGSLGLAVGVRSIETRQVAVFSYRASRDTQSSPARAIEAATRFAERMGFLFDEDVVASRDSDRRAQALGLWHDLTGVLEVEQAKALDQLAPPRSRPRETEPVASALEAVGVVSEPGSDPLASVCPPCLPAPAERLDPHPSADGAPSWRAWLSCRRRSGEREQSSRPGRLLRLLGVF